MEQIYHENVDNVEGTRIPFDLDGLKNSHVKVNLPETITKQDDEDFLSKQSIDVPPPQDL